MLQQLYSLIREEQGESSEKFKKLLGKFDSIDKAEVLTFLISHFTSSVYNCISTIMCCLVPPQVRRSVEDAQSKKKATLLEWALTWGKLDHATLLRKFWFVILHVLTSFRFNNAIQSLLKI